jgi:hypothetical protein
VKPCTTALQAGQITTILFMMQLCILAEPTGSAHVSRAYPHTLSPARKVFHHPASSDTSEETLAKTATDYNVQVAP